MLDLNTFHALNSDQKIKLRRMICDVHYQEMSEIIELNLDNFKDGELDHDEQEESDVIMLNFLQKRYTSVEDLIIKEMIRYLKTTTTEEERPSHDELEGGVQDDCERWMEIFPQLDTKTIKSKIFAFFETMPLPSKEKIHDGIDRSVFIDDKSVEEAFLEAIIPELLKDQPNIYLRLQDDGITNPKKLLEEVLENYDNTNEEHRLVVAELLNTFLQTGASFESVIAKQIFEILIKKEGDIESVLRKFNIGENIIKTILQESGLIDDPNVMTEEAAATIHHEADKVLIPAPEHPSGFLNLTFTHKDEILEKFLSDSFPLKELLETLNKKMTNKMDATTVSRMKDVLFYGEEPTDMEILKTLIQVIDVLYRGGPMALDRIHLLEGATDPNDEGVIRFLENMRILINNGFINQPNLNDSLILEIVVAQYKQEEKERERPKESEPGTEGKGKGKERRKVLRFSKRK